MVFPAEQRCRYIFRFYNNSSSTNQRMSFDEFKWMIKDIHKSKGQNLTGDALTEEALQMFRSFGFKIGGSNVESDGFLIRCWSTSIPRNICSLSIRNTHL